MVQNLSSTVEMFSKKFDTLIDEIKTLRSNSSDISTSMNDDLSFVPTPINNLQSLNTFEMKLNQFDLSPSTMTDFKLLRDKLVCN